MQIEIKVKIDVKKEYEPKFPKIIDFVVNEIHYQFPEISSAKLASAVIVTITHVSDDAD